MLDRTTTEESNAMSDPSTVAEVGAAVIAALRSDLTGLPSAEPREDRSVRNGVRETDDLTVSIVLRPIASGLPFGFFGLVVAATLVGAQAFGLLPKSATIAVGLLLLPTAVLQLVGGISALLGRDVIAATLMLVLSGAWLGTALMYLAHPNHGLETLAFWYFALSAVITCLIACATGKLLLSLVPLTGLPTFLLTGIWLISGTGKGLGEAVGVLSLVLALAGLYAGLALLLEDAHRRTILPTLRRGPMKQAFTDGLSAQVENLEHEAGVRQYL